MINTILNQTIALAGLTQAVSLVQSIARTGSADDDAVEVSLNSLLKISAEDVPDVFGGAERLAFGLVRVERQLGPPDRVDTEIARYAASLIFLEGKLNKSPRVQNEIREGVEKISATANRLGVLHDDVIGAFANLYQETISEFRPRVMVLGEPQHLTNTNKANRIRALLLAGVRAAVLWRQCGGSRWKFLLQRRRMREEAQQLLTSLKT